MTLAALAMLTCNLPRSTRAPMSGHCDDYSEPSATLCERASRALSSGDGDAFVSLLPARTSVTLSLCRYEQDGQVGCAARSHHYWRTELGEAIEHAGGLSAALSLQPGTRAGVGVAVPDRQGRGLETCALAPDGRALLCATKYSETPGFQSVSAYSPLLDPDSDGDGILVPGDRCPEQREDYNGEADLDGCPEGKDPEYARIQLLRSQPERLEVVDALAVETDDLPAEISRLLAQVYAAARAHAAASVEFECIGPPSFEARCARLFATIQAEFSTLGDAPPIVRVLSQRIVFDIQPREQLQFWLVMPGRW